MTPFLHKLSDGQIVEIDADVIREELGDFSKLAFQPARKAARISQGFWCDVSYNFSYLSSSLLSRDAGATFYAQI